jgi:VanZ family protein
LLRFKPAFLPAFGWLLMVTFLLCLPGQEFPKMTWLGKIWFDKWVHIGLFLVMVIFWCRALSFKNPGKLKTLFGRIVLLSIIYGVVMELVQQFFIPFRSFEFLDIVADGIGSLAGYLLSVRWYIKK